MAAREAELLAMATELAKHPTPLQQQTAARWYQNDLCSAIVSELRWDAERAGRWCAALRRRPRGGLPLLVLARRRVCGTSYGMVNVCRRDVHWPTVYPWEVAPQARCYSALCEGCERPLTIVGGEWMRRRYHVCSDRCRDLAILARRRESGPGAGRAQVRGVRRAARRRPR